jgi:phage-related protein (TIGR01555 family)
MDALMRLFTFGRLFGREAILIGADDGKELSEPLDEDAVKEIRFLDVIDRLDFYANTLEDDPTQPGYGLPLTWRVTRAVGGDAGGVVVVHKSRLLLAGGVLTSHRKRRENSWCDASVLQAAIHQLQRFNTDDLAVSNMMMDASQAILKIEGFTEILAGEDKDTLNTRMSIVDRGRSVSRIMPIDAMNEDFKYVERTFTGVPQIMERRQQLLAGAVGWPVVILFGREPAGLNATGEADIRAWYDTIHADRTTVYQPIIEYLIRIVATSLDIDYPEAWTISWPSLWQEAPKEKAERQKLVADTDKIYIETGVLDTDEVATARYGAGEWSDRAPQLDTDGREALKQQNEERLKGELGEEEKMPEPDTDLELVPGVKLGQTEAVQNTALNGAQITGLTEKILGAASRGEIPVESAKAAILVSFPGITEEQAETLIGPIRTFSPPEKGIDQPVTDGIRMDPDVPDKPSEKQKGSMVVQSVTLPGEWPQSKAQKWLREHDYKSTVERGGEKEEARWRARQFNPEHFVEGSFKVKEIESDIQLVLGKVK